MYNTNSKLVNRHCHIYMSFDEHVKLNCLDIVIECLKPCITNLNAYEI